MATPKHRAAPDTEFDQFGLVSLSEFLDDRFVYRDLQPVDPGYQGYSQCARLFGLDPMEIPRKTDRSYSKVAVWIVDHMQEMRQQDEVEELIFIGDTPGTDGMAFNRMMEYAQWKGSCFIGAENREAPPNLNWQAEFRYADANRWSLLADWVETLLANQLALDGHTAVIVDIDKTALGARGRNDQVINEARLAGMHKALEGQMDDFDLDAFRAVYDTIGREVYMGLTGDNQDYMIYICLMILSGMITLREVGELVKQKMEFTHLVRWISTQSDKQMSMQLRQLHDQYQMCTRTGDPTPFKQFRRQEFLETTERMGAMPAGSGTGDLLESEICVTQEVRELCLWLRERGCLLLSLSDKPREATVPHKRWHKGLPPMHRTQTHAVGVSIRDQLARIA